MPSIGAMAVTGNDEPTSEKPRTAIEVSIADGTESIRVEPGRRGVTLTNGTRWQQQLTREEAWRLAEAIDAAATSAPEPD